MCIYIISLSCKLSLTCLSLPLHAIIRVSYITWNVRTFQVFESCILGKFNFMIALMPIALTGLPLLYLPVDIMVVSSCLRHPA